MRFGEKILTQRQFDGLLDAGAMAGGGGVIGGLAGAVGGAQGSPDQLQKTGQSTTGQSTSQLQLGPLSQTEAQLQQNSLQQYLQQQALASQYQNNIGQAQGIQNQALGNYQNVLNGSAFQASPQQQALINQQQQYQTNQAMQNTNQLLNQNLGYTMQNAGQQGVRGQALSQLQGDAARTAALGLNQSLNTFGAQAAQNSLQMPYQTVAAQSPYTMGGSQMANGMLQQAQQNTQSAQNPYLLALLQQQYLATGTQNNQYQGGVNGQQTQVGQPGSFVGALGGFLSGAGGGASTGASASKAFGGGSTPASRPMTTEIA